MNDFNIFWNANRIHLTKFQKTSSELSIIPKSIFEEDFVSRVTTYIRMNKWQMSFLWIYLFCAIE